MYKTKLIRWFFCFVLFLDFGMTGKISMAQTISLENTGTYCYLGKLSKSSKLFLQTDIFQEYILFIIEHPEFHSSKLHLLSYGTLIDSGKFKILHDKISQYEIRLYIIHDTVSQTIGKVVKGYPFMLNNSFALIRNSDQLVLFDTLQSPNNDTFKIQGKENINTFDFFSQNTAKKIIKSVSLMNRNKFTLKFKKNGEYTYSYLKQPIMQGKWQLKGSDIELYCDNLKTSFLLKIVDGNLIPVIFFPGNTTLYQ